MSTLRLCGRLPEEWHNGLTEQADRIVDKPHDSVWAVVRFGVRSVTTATDDDERTALLEVRDIEALDDVQGAGLLREVRGDRDPELPLDLDENAEDVAVTDRTVFLDTETTGLGPDRQIWDLAYIVRDADGSGFERQAFLPVDLATADPRSLDIGGYWQRHPDPYGLTGGMPEGSDIFDGATGKGALFAPSFAAKLVAIDLTGAVVVGAVPWFDTETLGGLLRRHGLLPTWHYHLVDVETLAAGARGLRPRWDFDTVLAAYGLVYDEKYRHTALGDARMARDLYDAVLSDATVSR